MIPLKEFIDQSSHFLNEKGILNSRRQAEEILADALHMKRINLYLEFDRPLTSEEVSRCTQALQRRSQGEPAQYIRGKVDFLDCLIEVNSSVLIPRQETEILAARIIEDMSKADQKGRVLWDLCCGSGCIGIAIKKKVPQLSVVLSDVSPDVLLVAKRNAVLNQADVSFKEGDLLDPFQNSKANYVVCNPPYISGEDYAKLDKEVKDFEPQIALVAEDNGLSFYKRLADQLPEYLHPGAKVWLEIGYNQGESLLEIFQSPCWKHSRFERDWSGNHRFFFLEME